MIVSRSVNGIKYLTLARRMFTPAINKMVTRGHTYAYRGRAPPDPKTNLIGDGLGSIFWGWIIYHVINNYEHLIGEFHEPDPSLWTDEELGIPPDDAGL